jgi:hypothetical protein
MLAWLPPRHSKLSVTCYGCTSAMAFPLKEPVLPLSMQLCLECSFTAPPSFGAAKQQQEAFTEIFMFIYYWWSSVCPLWSSNKKHLFIDKKHLFIDKKHLFIFVLCKLVVHVQS